MFKKIIVFGFLSLFIYGADIDKRGEETYIVKDTVDIADNISPNMAKEQLLQSMRAELLKYVNGVDINSASIMERNSDGKATFDIFGEESINGVILEEKVISEKKDFKDNRFLINMEVQMKVGKPKGQEDTSYKMKVDGLREIYYSGDNLNLNVEVTKDSYVYIFVKDEDNKVYQYYPNKYQSNNFVKENTLLKYPDTKIFDMILDSPKGKDTLANIIVIASKEPINFLGFKYNQNYGLNIGEYRDFIMQIVGIDKSKLVKYSSIYKILGGKE